MRIDLRLRYDRMPVASGRFWPEAGSGGLQQTQLRGFSENPDIMPRNFALAGRTAFRCASERQHPIFDHALHDQRGGEALDAG